MGWDGRLSPFDGLLRAPYGANNWRVPITMGCFDNIKSLKRADSNSGLAYFRVVFLEEHPGRETNRKIRYISTKYM